MSLTATLAVAFFALSAVVLLIASSLQVFSNIQTQQETIASKQQLIAQDATRVVGTFIQEKFSVLDTATKLINPATVPEKEQQQILESLLGLQPAFRQLILLDTQDQELIHVSRLSQSTWEQLLADQVDREALAQIQQRERYISPVYIDPATSEPMVIMTVPIADALGDPQGTIVAEVNLKFMWDLVDQLKVGETGEAYVVDRQGNLIAYSDVARVLKGENVEQLAAVGEFMQNPVADQAAGVSMYSGITGETVVGTYSPLGTPDWAVVTELPWQEAYQTVIVQGLLSIGISIVMAVLAGVLGVYLARRLAAPLIKLMETANRITRGEMELQAEVAGPTEVSSLATAFNGMTAQLRQILAGLEQRVADRTQRLEIVATIGERLNAILDPNELVREVVNQISQNFGYYHTQIYLLDRAADSLVLTAGAGHAGQEMLAQQHSIALGAARSLVARAARSRTIVVADDVQQVEEWLANPLLPETRAEWPYLLWKKMK